MFSLNDVFQVTVIHDTYVPRDDGGVDSNKTGVSFEDEDGNLEVVLDMVSYYNIQPREKNDLTPWWVSAPSHNYEDGAETTFQLHIRRDGRALTTQESAQINRLIAEPSKSRDTLNGISETKMRNFAEPMVEEERVDLQVRRGSLGMVSFEGVTFDDLEGKPIAPKSQTMGQRGFTQVDAGIHTYSVPDDTQF